MISLSVLGTATNSQQPPRFRVSVHMVTIDAVVSDREGRPVRDLTADDFEVLQDGRQQKVVFAQFIPIDPVTTVGGRESDERLRSDVPAISARIRRENIQRTIAIVIDDLGLSFESIYYAKRALNSFIDNGLAPSDLVAIVRTGRSSTALQTFTTDRRVLHSIVDSLQWNGLSRHGAGAFGTAANNEHSFELSSPSTGAGSSSSQPTVVGDFRALDPLRDSLSAAGTLGALNLAVQGTRELPGRKAIVFVTDGFPLNSSAPRDKGQPDIRVRDALDKVIDQAARAGVVIYTLDARGLQTAAAAAEDAGTSGRQERMRLLFESQESITYLAEQTGGFAVINNNDLAQGLRRILEDVRDYYILGYEPDSATFKPRNGQPPLHQVTVKVRRPGLRIRTTKEFIGVSDLEPNGGEAPARQLMRAAMSPFAASDILLQPTALAGFSPQHGMFVRTLCILIHVLFPLLRMPMESVLPPQTWSALSSMKTQLKLLS